MPKITKETPAESYTIAGKEFNIFQPYKAGYVLLENEAGSMNQTFAENIRNNFAKQVKDAVEAGSFEQGSMQAALDEYMSKYEFGVRTGGGGRTTDPVQAEAMNIARDLVRKALRKAGHNLSDIPATEISRVAKEALVKRPDILVEAKARVERAQAVADIELGAITKTEAKPARKAAA